MHNARNRDALARVMPLWRNSFWFWMDSPQLSRPNLSGGMRPACSNSSPVSLSRRTWPVLAFWMNLSGRWNAAEGGPKCMAWFEKAIGGTAALGGPTPAGDTMNVREALALVWVVSMSCRV